MSDFHFLRPLWFLALLPLAAVVWRLLRRGAGGGAWQDLIDPALLPHVLAGSAAPRSRLPAGLAALAGSLAVLAMAGPTGERLPAPVFRNLSALVVVLDLSPAMGAGDLKPSRIEQARFKIDDILRARKDGQSALVVYAGDAFTVTPLTDDAATITAQLGALSPQLMPVQGNRVDLGLDRAVALLNQAGLRSGDVLLVTAGDGLDGAEDAAARLRKAGYRLSVLGVGTVEGAPIPVQGGGFLKDEKGAVRVPRLDRLALKRLAETGGGVYRSLEAGYGDLSTLLRFFEHRGDPAGTAGNTVRVDQWREDGIWLLPLLLALAALGFRRGWLGVWLFLVLVPLPRPAVALEWRDWWQNPDQRAQQELQAGQAEEAARRFEDPAWKAAALYRAGQFEQAAKNLERDDTARGQYNRGNALARAGKLEDALKAYDRAIQQKPGDEDAIFNRKLVEDALRKQQEQQEKQQQQQKQQGQNPEQKESGRDGKKQKDGQDSGKPEDGKPGDKDQAQSQPEQKPGDESSQASQSDGGDRSGQEGQEQGSDPGQQGAEPAPAPEKEGAGPEPRAADGETPQSAEGQPQPAPGEPVAPDDKADRKAQGAEARLSNETRQSEEQWLRRIPDDPGGLLKRKFYYQYRLRQQQTERNPW